MQTLGILSILNKQPVFNDSLPMIAIVEDEPILREEMAFQLRHLGFAVEAFENAPQLYRGLAVQRFPAVVLDIGLDGEDGLSIARYLREHDKDLGIVFVTARGLRNDRLTGLDIGADAYLVKPIDIDELALILRRLTHRVINRDAESAAPSTASKNVGADLWRLETDAGFVVTPIGIRVRMSLNEFQLLNLLFSRPGVVCTHTELSNALGLLAEEHDKHRIEVIISRLRAKILRDTGLQLPLRSYRGQGYAFGGSQSDE
jgi:DNA-binding response OmpR family regulator